MLLAQRPDRRANVIGADERVFVAEGFGMAIPLHDQARRIVILVAELQGNKLLMLHIRFAAIVQQLRGASAADAGTDGFAAGIRLLDRRDDLLFDLGHVFRIDAAFEPTGAPQTERVRPFVIVRAGNEDIAEARQTLTNAFDARMEETDEIDGNESNLLLAVFEDDRASLERIMYAGRLAILPETGHEHGFFLHAWRDVCLGEPDLQRISGTGVSPVGGRLCNDNRDRDDDKQEHENVA